MKDLDGEVLACLAEDLLLLLLDDLARPMMGVDDVVTDLELDELRLSGDLQVLDLLSRCLGDDCPPSSRGPAPWKPAVVLRLQVAVHEVDLL
jgi:hypothetical protein